MKTSHEELQGKWLQARYVVVFSASLLNAIFYLKRVNLSVTIVAIALDDREGVPHYNWDATERSRVLSSFLWGYTVMQLPSILIVRRFGPRYMGCIMCVISSIVTILFVPAASLGWQGACAARVLLGLTQAGLICTVQELLSRWAPVQERSSLVVYAYCGQQIGTITGMAGAGVVSDILGWPWVFYLSGGLGLILAVIWFFLVADSPAKHRMASPKEKYYIESSLSGSTQDRKNLKFPTKKALTSLPYLSLLLAYMALSWGFWTLLAGIPSYMRGVLHFDIKKDGLLSALPYLALWISGLMLGWLSDTLLKRKIWSVSTCRKVGNSISLYGSAVALLVLCFVEKTPATVVIILTISVAFMAGSSIGVSPNSLDLAPNFASTLAGIANQLGCLTGIAATLVIGVIVQNNDSEDQWRIVFLITAGFYFIGNTAFLFMGSGNEQPWNKPKVKENQEDLANFTTLLSTK